MGAFNAELNWGRVSERHQRILIVATGPSVKELDWRKVAKARANGLYVIAVKQAILIGQADAWVTVDPNPRAREMMRDKVGGVHYFAAVPDDYGSRRPAMPTHIGPPESGVTFLRRIAPNRRPMPKLSTDPRALHSGNSSWGALGIAYHMVAHRVGIIGLDATQEKHAIGKGAPNGSLEHLPALFETAVPQLMLRGTEVRMGGYSRVTCFPRLSARELISWLDE